MIIIPQDFETRSTEEIGGLKGVGASKYSKHPETIALMLAYGEQQWNLDLDEYAKDPAIRPECPKALQDLIENTEVHFSAHNAAFEIYIWENICVKRWGWPNIAIDRWHCTAARGCAVNQPRSLGDLTKRLGLTDDLKKDVKGKFLIKQLSCPVKTQKTYMKSIGNGPDGKPKKDKAGKVIKSVNKLSEQYLEEQGIPVFPMTNDKGITYNYFFNDDKKLFEEYRKYNLQDNVAETHAAKKLPPLPEEGQDLWILDREINMRGIPVDKDLCEGALKVYQEELSIADARMRDLTDGFVQTCSKNLKVLDWLEIRLEWVDMFTRSLKKPIIPDFLLKHKNRPQTWDDLDWKEGFDPEKEMPIVLEVLWLRDFAGGTAVSKYKAALRYLEGDGRIRDQLLIFGAATARWTGKGIQPHNMKRVPTLDESYVDALKSGDREIVEAVGEMEGKSVFDVLTGCIRGIVQAGPGKMLVVSDFAGIESRVLNTLVGNEYKLDLFRNNRDEYIHTALPIYGVEFDEIATRIEGEDKIRKEHKDKRDIGKACVGPNTDILTNSGWKPLRLIELTDKLWDGVGWVTHDGITFKGVKEVIDLDGVKITPDHGIYIGERKEQAWLLKENTELLESAKQSASLGLLVGSWDQGAGFSSTTPNVAAGLNACLTRTICTAGKQHVATIVLRLSQDLLEIKTWDTKLPCLTIGTELDGLTDFQRCCLDATIQKHMSFITMVGVGLPFSMNGEMIDPNFSDLYKLFPGGTIQSWRLTELTTTVVMNTAICEWSTVLVTPRIDELQVLSNITEVNILTVLFAESLPHSKQPAACREELKKGLHPKKLLMPVYDIVNVGLRNRFTVKTCTGVLQISNCTLGLGYGMAWKTFQANALKSGNELTDEFAQDVVTKWREASPEIPQFWQDIEDACKDVIRNEASRRRSNNPGPRLVKEVCGLKVGYHPRGYLLIKLPSGRYLYYYAPTLAKDNSPDAKFGGKQIFYLDGSKKGARCNKFRISTYAGKLAENCTQAIARDLLVNSMWLIKKAGLNIVGHVHDEIIVEVDENKVDEAFKTVHSAMETVPSWFSNLPLKSETYSAKRYTK